MSSSRRLSELEDFDVEALLPEARSISVERIPLTLRTGLFPRIGRQPLFHFLLAGCVLFVATSLLEHKKDANSREIHVSTAEIQRLEDVWSRQYGRTPTPSELRNLVEDYVREEIYYREAIASGLDKADSIIRRRLVEKMEFLSQEVASGDPTAEELQQYFAGHRDKFQLPPQIAFSHIFFSPSKHGTGLQLDAQKALALLRQAKSTVSPSQLGDAFMLQSEYPLQTPDEIKALFGSEFSNAVFKLQPGEWSGPISSSYGIHLVRVAQYQPAHTPQLDEVRTQVITDLKNDRLQTATEKYYARLRQRYQVDIDNAAVAAAIANGSSDGRRTSSNAEQSGPDVD